MESSWLQDHQSWMATTNRLLSYLSANIFAQYCTVHYFTSNNLFKYSDELKNNFTGPGCACLNLFLANNCLNTTHGAHGAAMGRAGRCYLSQTHFSSQLWLLNDNELSKQADNLVCRQIRPASGASDDAQLQLETGCKSLIWSKPIKMIGLRYKETDHKVLREVCKQLSTEIFSVFSFSFSLIVDRILRINH